MKTYYLFLILLSYFSFLINYKLKNEVFDKFGYISISVLATPLILLRSKYSGLDDLGYLDQYKSIISRNYSEVYENYAWEYAIKTVDIIVGNINSIYFLILILFIIKIFIFYLNTKQRLPAILTYLILFFPLHELTQFRISAAITFLLIGMHYAFNNKNFQSIFFYATTSLLHQAVFLTPTLALSNFLNLSIWIYKSMIAIFAIMVLCSLVPSVDTLQNIYHFLNPTGNLPDYLFYPEWFAPDYLHTFPLSLIPLTLFLTMIENNYASKKEKIIYMSFMVGYFLFWLFASVYVIGGRYQEFFLVPLVFLTGISKRTVRNYILFNIIISTYFIKYNVLSSFFI